MSKTSALGCSFNQSWNVTQHKPVTSCVRTIWKSWSPYTQVRNHSGEWIIGNFRLGPCHCCQQGGLSSRRHRNNSHIGNNFERQFQELSFSPSRCRTSSPHSPTFGLNSRAFAPISTHGNKYLWILLCDCCYIFHCCIAVVGITQNLLNNSPGRYTNRHIFTISSAAKLSLPIGAIFRTKAFGPIGLKRC